LDLSGCSHTPYIIVLPRFFKSARPRGVSAKMAFSFCKAFSFVPLVAKEKASKALAISNR
jgi:hypothetical protein